MNKLINKLILITTVLTCNTQYASSTTKELDLTDFNKAFLDGCGVVDSPTETAMEN